ncbi:DUF397 domain-containing protein [Actinophytocola sp.]|uniref:DUF397 domain-containing protein n=1 Tax=Actinophytocola sp. TaxID=1872138 RepID=UPI0025BD2417|nr:DUF397 domain-containing protein [Actinophytocola sp.]
MHQEPLRFRKSTRSGGQSECVEIGHTLRHLRDSKNPTGPLLDGVDVAALIRAARTSA